MIRALHNAVYRGSDKNATASLRAREGHDRRQSSGDDGAENDARMAELDQEREAVQAALSFEPGRADADSAARAAGEECSAAWAALLALAEEAKASNERNANMVFAHLDFTQNALRFLRASGQPFYGPDGTRKTPAGAGTRLAPG